MRASVEFTVESLSAYRAPDKLVRAGIPVLYAKSLSKTSVRLKVAAKDRKKAFAILRQSCYNVENIRYRGLYALGAACRRAAGLILGAVVFCGAALFLESRVLRVEIAGSGAYYAREIAQILKEEGVTTFSAFPADTGALTAKILELDRVEFCSFRFRGGVLTVDVEVGDSAQVQKSMPLLSPATGTVEELVVVRGTPLCKEGDRVRLGDVVVGNFSEIGGERREAVVMARITVRYAAEREYAASEEEALAQAYLDFGPLEDLRITKTEKGCRIGGTAFSTAALGLT